MYSRSACVLSLLNVKSSETPYSVAFPYTIKLITFSLTKIIRFIRSLSLVQFVAPRQIRAEIIYLRVDFLDRMRMAVEKPDLPVFSYTFQGIFNATVFSELTHHTKTKMIIFTIGPLQGFRLLQVNRQ